MSDKTESVENWLPKVFSWIDSVAIENSADEAKGHCLVVVNNSDDPKNTDDWQLDAPAMTDSLKKKVKTQAQKLGWTPDGGSGTVSLGDTLYFLLVPTKGLSDTVRMGQQLGLDAASLLGSYRCGSLSICPTDKIAARDILLGFAQGLYKASGFREKPKDQFFPEKIVIQSGQDSAEGWAETRSMIRALALTRTIEDAPANRMNPEMFAAIARDFIKGDHVSCRIRSGQEIADLGMGSFASVAQGSPLPAQFIELSFAGKKPGKKAVLIGKGLTFDSGGTNLKPSAGMAEMKYDMCGGAAVLGTAYYLSQHQPESDVVCMIGAVENIGGGKATRPGDIVTSLSGKTIEVLNTDAEGRLVLCDLLSYAVKEHKPDFCLDIATLTGAVLMALGSVGAAVMSNNPQAEAYFRKHAEGQGEVVWPMPLWPEHVKEIRSDIADLKNIAASNVRAGTVVAGCFLQEFVDKTPWVHLDIAGTGWNCKAFGYPSSGASGFAVKSLVSCVSDFSGL